MGEDNIYEREFDRKHKISEIAPDPLLREIGPEDIERYLEEYDYQFSKIEQAKTDVRHEVTVWEVYSAEFVKLTSNGLMDEKNTIAFSERVSDSLEWYLVRKICKQILKARGVEVQEEFSSTTVANMEVNTPEGFLVNQMMSEAEKNDYMKLKSEIYQDLCEDIDGVNSVDVLKKEMEKFYSKKSEIEQAFF